MIVLKKTVSCCICGGHDFNELYKDELGDSLPPVDYDFSPETRNTYRIVKCTKCGHIFTNPMPSMEDAYDDSANDVYHESCAQRIKTFEKLYHLACKVKTSGKVLDIGCATGLLLDVFGKSFETYGVEPSKWSRAKCDPQHKVVSSLDELEGETFDVILLLGVIEHIVDPDSFTSMISGMLKKGGIFLVYTGDVDALLPRILKKKWWWYQGMHIHYFSKKTLSLMLAKHGIKVTRSLNMPLYFSIASLSTSLRRYKLLHMLFGKTLEFPAWKEVLVPMPLSGEMLLVCKK